MFRLVIGLILLPIAGLAQQVLSGQVVDAATQEPLPYATVQLVGTQHGIVTNNEGRFILQLANHRGDSIRISSVGYAVRTLAVAAWPDAPIALTERPIQLASVLITDATPESLLREAIRRHAENAPSQAQSYRGFYRELEVWKDGTFANVRSTEAVLDFNRPGTASKNLRDPQFRVIKARQIGTMDDSSAKEFQDVAGMKGGPYKMLDDSDLDDDRLKGRILNPDSKEYNTYRRKIEGIIQRDGRDTYVISFVWNGEEPAWRPEGKIYLDAETKAIAAYEYEVPPTLRPHGPGLSLLGFGFRAQDAMVSAQFRHVNGKWYPTYLRRGYAIRLTAKNEKRQRQFRENLKLGPEFDAWYYAEYYVTDMEPTMPAPFSKDQVLREKDRMAQQRTDASDAFWAGYSYVPAAGIDWLLKRQ